MKSFKDQVAAITGAGSGMGRALALELATRGCHLALSDVSDDTLAATVELLKDKPVKVTSQTLDVADRAAVEAFAANTHEQHGKVNLVFNNAGVSVTANVEQLRYEDFEWLMNINFWGVVHGTKAFLPYLRQADEAHIVNTASIFGVIAVPSQSAYNASKFAVRGFTEALKQELEDASIGVSCILPGGVKTNIVKTSRYYATDNIAPTKDEAIQFFETLAGLTADQAAQIILRGVQRGRLHVLVGGDAKTIAILQRLLPERYGKVLRWLQERNQKRLARDTAAQQ